MPVFQDDVPGGDPVYGGGGGGGGMAMLGGGGGPAFGQFSTIEQLLGGRRPPPGPLPGPGSPPPQPPPQPPPGGGGGLHPLVAASLGRGQPLNLAGLISMRRQVLSMMPRGDDMGMQTSTGHDVEPMRSYAYGGVIDEPVSGFGLRSGARYQLGEAGPEAVTPMNRMRGVMGSFGNWGAPRQPAAPAGPAKVSQVDLAFGDPVRQQLQNYLESLGLAQQGAAGRAAAYFAGNDPSAASYAQLNALLGSQGRTAQGVNEFNNEYLQNWLKMQQQRFLTNEAYQQQQIMQRLQNSNQPGTDWGGILGGVGRLAGAFTGSPWGPDAVGKMLGSLDSVT